MKRSTVLFFLLSAFFGACGGAQPRGEATWETHTTAPEDEPDDGVPPEDDY